MAAANKKDFTAPSDLKAAAEKKTPPLLLHDENGLVVGKVAAPMLWPAEVWEHLRNESLDLMAHILVGDDYDAVVAAGWTPGLIFTQMAAHWKVTLGE